MSCITCWCKPQMQYNSWAMRASRLFSFVDREDIKPQLNKEYGDLCSANVPVTEWLFGDDLQTKLTHIHTANRVGSTGSQAHGFHRRGNRAGSKAPANSTSSFLSRAMPPLGRQNQPSWNNRGKSYRGKQQRDQTQRK